MKRIQTEGAPAAIGPYSQAMAAGGFLFCSGQIGLDPSAGELVSGGVAAQAKQALLNLDAVLQAGGARMEAVVRTTIFLADMADFAAVNTVYAAAFGEHRPARATVAARGLPKGALVEIDAIAHLGGSAS